MVQALHQVSSDVIRRQNNRGKRLRDDVKQY